ncbi:1-deoxy-D-xylulose-5-phosphate reductoisomerase [Balneolales bacterium ANBcel1]|nr:1-deoxy-D-xylulose-5-phosphate reductoisomerase [Balneolales bacterium ANBcel1]
MKTQQLLILGSTGSIGRQTLDIVRSHPERFSLFGVTANSNWKELAAQINEFQPAYAVISDESCAKNLDAAINHRNTVILTGNDALEALIREEAVDTIVNSLVGFSGFAPTLTALEHGKKVALANKESLVVGGELLSPFLDGSFDRLIPIDSEHSAILQCLAGESADSIHKLIITASGGPFRTWSAEKVANANVRDALMHPNWDMGSKITIDSATMMNKGLEVIEAHWLFNLPLSKIEAVVHPQSIIHSMVVFRDGSIKSQMGLPDMRLPIQYALSHPDRWPLESEQIDWAEPQELTFEPVDHNKFPCYDLALEALRQGGYAPAVLNASNEVAVERFLKEEISYIHISEIVASSLSHITSSDSLSLPVLLEVDREARKFARSI